jgi:hypothetical protein
MRLSRGANDAEAVARGFIFACRAPLGHSVSWHRTEDAATIFLARALRGSGCVVVCLAERRDVRVTNRTPWL